MFWTLRAWGERVELGGRVVDALDRQLEAGSLRQILEALEVVVEEMAAKVDEGLGGLGEGAGVELRVTGTDDRALGDQHLISPLAGEVGAPQLKPQLGRAAGQDQDRGAGVTVESLAIDGAAVDDEAERERRP